MTAPFWVSIGCPVHPKLVSQLSREALILSLGTASSVPWLVHRHPLRVKTVAFYSSFYWRVYKNLMSSFVKCLFCFYSDVHCILTLVNVVNHVDWFWMLNSFCISGNNLTSLYFIYCWNRFGDTFGLECSLLYVHKIYSSLSLQ